MLSRIPGLGALGGAGFLLLLTCVANAAGPPPAVAHFQQNFDTVLTQHHIVGGAFGIFASVTEMVLASP